MRQPTCSGVACVFILWHAQNRFLIIFGGGSVANCYNDVVMLDTKTLEWSTPQITGTPPTPRAGTSHRAFLSRAISLPPLGADLPDMR